MKSISEVVGNVADSVKQGGQAAEFKKQLDKLESRQDGQIRDLRSQVQALSKLNRRGGFPWGLLLVAGGAVYLYRTNERVRSQVDGLLKRINPGIEGNLSRAGDAAKDAIGQVMQGENASDSAKAALGELKRAGEKTADKAQGLAKDAGDKLQDAADTVKDKAGQLGDKAQDTAKKAGNAVQIAADTIKDKTDQAKNDAQRASNTTADDWRKS